MARRKAGRFFVSTGVILENATADRISRGKGRGVALDLAATERMQEDTRCQ
jgi:hypothetical protein